MSEKKITLGVWVGQQGDGTCLEYDSYELQANPAIVTQPTESPEQNEQTKEDVAAHAARVALIRAQRLEQDKVDYFAFECADVPFGD